MNVEIIIDKLVNMNMIRVSRKVGNYMQIYCPIHNDGNERKPSCGILLTAEYRNGQHYPEGWCHCFSCGYAKSLPDLITDLLKSKSISKSGLDWLKENIPEFEADGAISALLPKELIQTMNNLYAIEYINNLTSKKVTYVSEEELARYRFTVPYMYERKLTDELIDKFDVGFDANYIPEGRKHPVPCITFPVKDREGRTLFICRRSIAGKSFYMPAEITKPVYGLYELPKGCKSVLVVESIFNALTSWAYGIPSVALLGTGTPYQMQQLRELGVKEYISGLDPDESGQKGYKRLKNALRDIAIVRKLDIPVGKDINDLLEPEFNYLLQTRI